jgi:hydroxysqualene dehydroxylase
MTQAVAAELWRDVSRPFGLAAVRLPPYRLLTEKRATFLQTPENLRRRPKPATAVRNLLLAGDWTDTGLPATIEGAILSGRRAAELALA